MQIDEAIRVVRGAVKQKRAYIETMRAHPIADERYMQHVVKNAEREAEAMETVCAALEAERNRSKAANVIDFLADSAGDGRNGTR